LGDTFIKLNHISSEFLFGKRISYSCSFYANRIYRKNADEMLGVVPIMCVLCLITMGKISLATNQNGNTNMKIILKPIRLFNKQTLKRKV